MIISNVNKYCSNLIFVFLLFTNNIFCYHRHNIIKKFLKKTRLVTSHNGRHIWKVMWATGVDGTALGFHLEPASNDTPLDSKKTILNKMSSIIIAHDNVSICDNIESHNFKLYNTNLYF